MNPTISIKIPRYLFDVSQIIGKERMKANDENRKRRKDYDMKERNYQIDAAGALAELIVKHYFDTKELSYISPPMVAEKPQAGPDLIYMNSRIDVKAIMNETAFFNVDKKSFEKSNKDITHYIFVQIIDNDTAFFYKFTRNEIATWETYTFKESGSAVYRKLIN